jgi:hypothetical protein
VREKFLDIFSKYLLAQVDSEAFSKMESTFKGLERELSDIAELKGYVNLKVISHYGSSRSANVPWIVFNDNSGKGKDVRVMFLFKADMSGVYLTINQGAGKIFSSTNPQSNYLHNLQEISCKLSSNFSGLVKFGFSDSRNVDLSQFDLIAKSYEMGTVIHKYYSKQTLPQEHQLVSDVQNILDSYNSFVKSISKVDGEQAEHYILRTTNDGVQTRFSIEQGENNPVELDLEEYMSKLDLNHIAQLPSIRLRHPEMAHVDDLMAWCSDTTWVLPRFQRYFDWKKDDISSFLKAIFSNYYIGSFLMWHAGGEPIVAVDPIKGVDDRGKENKSEMIILDGQQRITSLFYAICAPKLQIFEDKFHWRDTRIYKEHPIYFYIDFDTYLKDPQATDIIKTRNRQLSYEECFKFLWFPLAELKDKTRWLAILRKYLENHSSDHDKIYDLIEVIRAKLDGMLTNYEVPYITLPKEMGLEQVTEIFEQLNTKGKRLSVFDLLIARLYNYNIHLKDLWNETTKQYPTVYRYSKIVEKTPIYILQSMSLYYDAISSVDRKDILNIYERIYQKSTYDFTEHWKEFSEYVNLALQKLENLRDGFGVKDAKQVPFAPMIPVLAALLKYIEQHDNPADCYNKLKKWYWASIFTNAYSESADTQMTNDFKEMKNWFNNTSEIPKSVRNISISISYLRLREIQSKSSAKYRGVMSLVALEGAQDFASSLKLENARNNDQHHLFPMSGEFGNRKDINSIVNLTWLSKDSNREISKNEKPSDYIKYFVKEIYHGDENKFIGILKTHLINKKAYDYLIKDEYDLFLQEREDTIIAKLREILEIENTTDQSTLISPDDPFKNAILYRDMVRSCDEFLFYVDKYFTADGLRFLSNYVDSSRTKSIKILMAIDYATEDFRDLFKAFQKSFGNKGVTCELRVMSPELRRDLHDRWILSKNKNYSIPSPQTIERGQWSAINETKNVPPFEQWWASSKDIINDWSYIRNYRDALSAGQGSKS